MNKALKEEMWFSCIIMSLLSRSSSTTRAHDRDQVVDSATNLYINESGETRKSISPRGFLVLFGCNTTLVVKCCRLFSRY